jgi:FtsP/CotA-like multicopper oxidase with cupredoxin domain
MKRPDPKWARALSLLCAALLVPATALAAKKADRFEAPVNEPVAKPAPVAAPAKPVPIAAPAKPAPSLGAPAQAHDARLQTKLERVREQQRNRITQDDRAAAARRQREQLRKAAPARAAAGLPTGAATKQVAGSTRVSAAAAPPGTPFPPTPVFNFTPQIPAGMTPPGPGGQPDYYTTPNWAFSPQIRKFVDRLPGLGPDGANELGNYLPVAAPDTITYPGSDYYEIELREFQQQLHSDLGPTTLRGYVQVNAGTDAGGANTVLPPPNPDGSPRPYYLGPLIVAERDRPVRIKFTNRLPTGPAGDMNIPVDVSVMGAGEGTKHADGSDCDPEVEQCATYTQNRATIHLHGGRTPWISDGTPHQWIVPEGEVTPYQHGVSLRNVPDMPDPGPGSQTFYWSNQQSARLMFWHDHAWGITRLNVYVGEAAGLLITDQYEQQLVDSGAIPAEQIPLILQDKTFVDPETVRVTDPTWNWGSAAPDANGVRPPQSGDLWLPHVYVPAQNPFDITGANAFGRWVYGPWFWPPTTDILHGPVPNPYAEPACSSTDPIVYATECTTPGQPPQIPGTPHPSMGMEAFHDTMLANGTAFPYLEVDPRAYRFRILNASGDRFMNLQLYTADPDVVALDGRTHVEPRMVPAVPTPTWPALWPQDGRDGGVPDPATKGPRFVQIGTEGGFLPRPVVIDQQPVNWVTDPTVFNAGNVKDKALLLGPAERADVVIDFSQYAGQTLILYNDAPTAFPALDVRTDFYAGAPDLSDSGGHPGPYPGYGPNTRTIMQIRVRPSTPAAPFDVAALNAAFQGLFERAQDPIVVGQAAYNGVYAGVTFPGNWPAWGVSRIQDNQIMFRTVGGELLTLPMQAKGIHDEMGASFDKEYGRMSGNLGLELANTVVGRQNFTLLAYADPVTETVKDSIVPLGTAGDGTQLWKITHNGVDTHPIHFHIFDVQLVNRVGWDGLIRLPDANELGWKDTIRISPLEDTIVAVRPYAPALPFGIPNSVRPLNPATPIGSTMGLTQLDPYTGQPLTVTNQLVDFGWEYVWHCHILSHEEMDMMRSIKLEYLNVAPTAPSAVTAQQTGLNELTVTWTDATPVNYVTQSNFGNHSNEIGFRVERSEDGTTFTQIATALANATTYTDRDVTVGRTYTYRVVAFNEAGVATSQASSSVTNNRPPATGVVLSASAASPVLVGTPVVFTAQGQGSVDYQYRFWLWSAGTATLTQNWSTNSTWTMPATTGIGTYTVQADVRTGTARDALATMPFTVGIARATGVTLSSALPSPQAFGTPVTFTASGQGSTGYQYRFWLWSGPTATIVRDWSSDPNWVMPATTLPGAYTVQADVRTGSARDAQTTLPFTITIPPATGVMLTPSVPSPQAAGTSVTFTAQGQGSAFYQYRFWLWSNGTATLVQNWSNASTWTLPAATPGGAYTVQVDVRTGVLRDAVATLPFVLTIPTATGVTLTSSVPSPVPQGQAVTFTAQGQGSTSYQYRFWLWSGGTATLMQNWSATPTWTMSGSTPQGSYTVQADVRTGTVRDANILLPFEIR